jgi:hypothetical protein
VDVHMAVQQHTCLYVRDYCCFVNLEGGPFEKGSCERRGTAILEKIKRNQRRKRATVSDFV